MAEFEKTVQYLRSPNDKSNPEKITYCNKDKFVILDIYVEIGDGKQKITVPKEYIEYSDRSKGEITKTGNLTGEIEEAIKIYKSSSSYDKENLWAILKLSIKFKENIKKEMTLPLEAGSFTGIGTGALEGALMGGIDKIMKDFECAESPTGWGATYARIGFIKGWPPDVISWPPS